MHFTVQEAMYATLLGQQLHSSHHAAHDWVHLCVSRRQGDRCNAQCHRPCAPREVLGSCQLRGPPQPTSLQRLHLQVHPLTPVILSDFAIATTAERASLSTSAQALCAGNTVGLLPITSPQKGQHFQHPTLSVTPIKPCTRGSV